MKSPRFKFGLERVREIREHDEDRAKEAFAASLAQRAKGAAMLAAATEQLGHAHDTQRGGAPERSAHDLVAMQTWLEQVERSRVEAEQRLQHHDAELVGKRRELAEASQKRQALERLKERRKAEHTLAAARAESAFLDEVALSQHVRKHAA
jgi:flagellar protein FliJ